jgi:hypothetical protein
LQKDDDLMTNLPHILDGYQFEGDFATDCGVTRRTVWRYRQEPDGLPWVQFGGKVYINIEGGKKWLARRARQRNPRRSSNLEVA